MDEKTTGPLFQNCDIQTVRDAPKMLREPRTCAKMSGFICKFLWFPYPDSIEVRIYNM